MIDCPICGKPLESEPLENGHDWYYCDDCRYSGSYE